VATVQTLKFQLPPANTNSSSIILRPSDHVSDPEVMLEAEDHRETRASENPIKISPNVPTPMPISKTIPALPAMHPMNEHLRELQSAINSGECTLSSGQFQFVRTASI